MSKGFKNFFLGDVSSPTTLQIRPTFDYFESVESRRFTQEAESGKVKQYKLEGGQFRFSLPFDLTNSSDTNQIRDYWRDKTTVRFSNTYSNVNLFVDCRIINNNDPFKSYTQARYTDFDGVLTLLSVNDQNTNRGIQKSGVSSLQSFILDDAIQGILDNNIYRLG